MTTNRMGFGHDVVAIAVFAEQLSMPGSRMRGLFSARELRQAQTRARLKGDDEATHLAARWAGKEAVLKAWCEAVGEGEYPYTLDDFPWSQIEILDDSRGRPHVVMSVEAEQRCRHSLSDVADGGTSLQWHISLTHDGGIASAVAMLQYT